MQLPIFLIIFIIILLILANVRHKEQNSQKKIYENFLAKEQAANSTRKKDISNLDYIPFSAECLPIGTFSDDILNSCETALLNLSGQKILNLTDKSNTDLKLLYGPANLTALTEYDENYHQLADTLLKYAIREQELERIDESITILEYAMSLHIDSSQIYILLAKLYQQTKTPEKINGIISVLHTMDEKFCSFVLPKLEAFHIDE